MNESRDGGGSCGKDIASCEADNLWAHGMPGGLECSVGNTLPPATGKAGTLHRPFRGPLRASELCSARRVPA